MAKKNFINRTHIEGWLYDAKIEEKVTGAESKSPGTSYLRATLSVATDDAITNIVSVSFPYVVPITSTGKQNLTYEFLTKVMDGTFKYIMNSSKEEAVKIRIDSAIGLNEFYVSDKNEESGYRLVSAKQNAGGFINIVKDNEMVDERDRSTFETDILITKVTRKEANEEKGLPEKVVVRGAIFDFRKTLLPVEFSVLNSRAMDYFESLEASYKTPVFTKVRGKQESIVTQREIEEEGAFGEIYIRMVPVSHKDFVITFAQKEPYEWDSEETITATMVKEAQAARETYLATLKQRAIDSENKKKTISTDDDYQF